MLSNLYRFQKTIKYFKTMCYHLFTKKAPFQVLFYGAESRGRTGTGAKSQQILSLLRLPIPPYPHRQ